MATDSVLAAIDRGLDQSLDRLFALLRIPSVSADPAFSSECRKAADWLVNELTGLGFKADVRPTKGHPMVVAHYGSKAGGPKNGGPRVLFYGHYDVQPPDPLELWKTPPFEPRFEGANGDRRIVARGVADDKG